MSPAGPYVRRETMISVVINVALSGVFFLLVFGRTDPIPAWGVGKYAYSIMLQSLMVALVVAMLALLVGAGSGALAALVMPPTLRAALHQA